MLKHIRVETPIALHSVAHRVSHRNPAESEMSRQNRATPPQIKVSHLSPDPPVALSSRSQQARGAAGWWRVSRHFRGSENGSRYRGVSQLQSHQSRYSVQLSPKILALFGQREGERQSEIQRAGHMDEADTFFAHSLINFGLRGMVCTQTHP